MNTYPRRMCCKLKNQKNQLIEIRNSAHLFALKWAKKECRWKWQLEKKLWFSVVDLSHGII